MMPITVFGANLTILIICFIWLFSGDYKLKFKQISKSKFLVASIIFFSIHVIGLLWTEDLSMGVHITKKMWYFFLLLPILYTIVKKEFISYYINAFLSAIALTLVISFLVWFQIIPEFKAAQQWNPTPFTSHISHNPIIALAIYLVGYKLLLGPKLSLYWRHFNIVFLLLLTFNMFITGGRAGQIMFIAILCILILQWQNFNKLKSIGIILILIPGILFTAYQFNDTFKYRTDLGIENIRTFKDNYNTSIGIRVIFITNSWEIISKNPFIGAGTGDFALEYKKVNEANTPELPNSTNPHNMYILILTQLGLLGLVSFLSIFYYQIKFSLESNNKLTSTFGVALPLSYLLIMWSDTYLLGHFTSLIFIFFSSFLYKDFEKS
jgi:O-antigen ligase